MKIKEVLERANAIKEAEEAFLSKENRPTGAVLFVDLVGSTAYKNENPDEKIWLPRLAAFLKVVTDIVQKHNGQVVKYIGDEVMAFYESAQAIQESFHTVEELFTIFRDMETYKFEIKVSLDFGPVSILSFNDENSPTNSSFMSRDPNGTVIDRAARIMSKCKSGTALCSKAYATQDAMFKGRWIEIGSFRAKGIREDVEVYQLESTNSTSISLSEIDNLSFDECREKLRICESQLREANEMIRKRKL